VKCELSVTAGALVSRSDALPVCGQQMQWRRTWPEMQVNDKERVICRIGDSVASVKCTVNKSTKYVCTTQARRLSTTSIELTTCTYQKSTCAKIS